MKLKDECSVCLPYSLTIDTDKKTITYTSTKDALDELKKIVKEIKKEKIDKRIAEQRMRWSIGEIEELCLQTGYIIIYQRSKKHAKEKEN